MDNWLRTYQQAQGDVAKLKHQYLAKTRRADEAEDEYGFFPHIFLSLSIRRLPLTLKFPVPS